MLKVVSDLVKDDINFFKIDKIIKNKPPRTTNCHTKGFVSNNN
jgi:hypothetical protein